MPIEHLLRSIRSMITESAGRLISQVLTALVPFPLLPLRGILRQDRRGLVFELVSRRRIKPL